MSGVQLSSSEVCVSRVEFSWLRSVKAVSSKCRGVVAIKMASGMSSNSVTRFVSSAPLVSGLSKRRVGCVSGVRVKRSVASELSLVALASGPRSQGPKSAVLAALERSRRAAADRNVQRLRQRFASQAPVRRQSEYRVASQVPASGWLCRRALRSMHSVSSRSVASELKFQSRRVPSTTSVTSVEFIMSRPGPIPRLSMSRIESECAFDQSGSASLRVQSVASASVGEWRPVGDALRNVLSQLASKQVEASATVSSLEPKRVH